jgi:hypothetical protein
MATHAFNDESDFAKGGTWYGDYGRHFCKWSWDPATKTLAVQRGARGKRIDLGAFDPHDLTTEQLRQRLPELALQAAQRITEES